MNKGKIITFYSYKGGVGRTMSLANIATILTQWGKNVLVVDWDLEAPGLEKYFVNYSKNSTLGKKRGVIDILIDRKLNSKAAKSYLQEIRVSDNYKLNYLGSGKKGNDYFEKLRKLDIDRLYEDNYGFEFIERLRNEWKSEFDYVLIDSRTGITDTGGICTIQLPDILLVFTNTNEQSVYGTREVIERINAAQQSQPYDRQNLLILPILCRFDTTTEFEISQIWIKKVADNLQETYNDWLPLSIELKEFIEKTKIPYFPYFSFGEKLSVLEQGLSDPSSMGYAYESIASIIVHNFENIDSFMNNRSAYIGQARKTFNLTSTIKVIGVGGGGGNAVNHMFLQNINDVDFIISNTDRQALEVSPIPTKIQLMTEGLGAGSIPEVGRKAAKDNITEIKNALEANTKLLLITAGMGGGTGTGASPVIASIAKSLDILTVGVVTFPFSFEGRKRRRQAITGINELSNYVDTLIILNNDSLQKISGNLTISKAFQEADNILAIAVKTIVEIITVRGYVNIDFKDMELVLRNSGLAIMGFGIAQGENRALHAVKKALESPLLNGLNINGSKHVLLHITTGNKDASMEEIDLLIEHIVAEAGSKVEIIWGIGVDESLKNEMRVTLIATGLGAGSDNFKKDESKARSFFDFDFVKPDDFIEHE